MMHLILGWAVRNIPAASDKPLQNEPGYTTHEGTMADFAVAIQGIQGIR